MGKLDRELVLRIFREAMGIGIALACISWVLVHLIIFFFYGYVLVGETNKFILVGEVALTSVGLFCLLLTFYKDRFSSRE
ncbi:MAG: hypothetical protein OEW95_05485 [Candidatus Bathyarchaeota archaeon]|jgi:hypothetical protein|nr:hypothetical protein [Candidatus Bathyarchaeota archaeon]